MTNTRQHGPKSEGERERNSAEDPRVRFAAERTLLAWIRTGLALMGFGFVVARFGLFLREVAAIHEAAPQSHGWSSVIGIVLVVLGIAVTLLAASEHWGVIQRLNRGESYLAPRWSLGLLVSAVLVVIGAGLIAYLTLIIH
jgi:putative membrane protein